MSTSDDTSLPSSSDPVRMRIHSPQHEANIDRKSDVDVSDGGNTTPRTTSEYSGSTLEVAACNFEPDKVKAVLILPETDVNDVNLDGQNAFHEMTQRYVNLHAIERSEFKKKYIAILKLMVDKDLYIDALFSGKSRTFRDYKTALHLIAACPDSGDIIRAFHDSGADVNKDDGKKRGPLHQATTYTLFSNIQTLLGCGADPNKEDEYQQTPLHYAVKGRSRRMDMITTLVAAGSDVNAKDTTNRTPIHLAAKYGNVKAMELLVSSGGHVGKSDGSGMTPIHYAATYDNTGKILQHLLKFTSEVNTQSEASLETPLHKAVCHHVTENVIILCESGKLDANMADINGDTALHKAVQFEDWDLWLALLKAGGDVYRANHMGVTPHVLLKRAHNKLGTLVSRYNKHNRFEI